ncbi:hypothetical protein EON65_31740 [archaeon]|nr:MAG: hypothetical protein EON65_31740 [archaeon]
MSASAAAAASFLTTPLAREALLPDAVTGPPVSATPSREVRATALTLLSLHVPFLLAEPSKKINDYF